ncbi:MAG: hypothetical protein MJZ69_09750 [Bacteroidaceae bacterium]|nr:hypothetical protein [Bacteroidaceae bacterium]
MKKIVLLYLLVLLFTACSTRVNIVNRSSEKPVVLPDYTDVTIPCNIAPLNFSVQGLTDAALVIKGDVDSICLTTSDGNFDIPLEEWHQLLAAQKGHALQFTVCRSTENGWEGLQPFNVQVSNDSIDPYVVYRLLPPGYGLWNRMSLMQRNLQNFQEEEIYANRYGRGNCVNCHSFAGGKADTWQVHVRHNYGGTFVVRQGKMQKLNVQGAKAKPVYPAWHPDGRFIAYSTNNTFFHIHTADVNRWEVMDDGSDVMVVDTENGEVLTAPQFTQKEKYETFPAFSPDGKWLYYCTAQAVDTLTRQFQDVRYSLCRIPFDAQHRTFGTQVDTLYSAPQQGSSATMPRVSPDGKWLCFVRQPYGQFATCHLDATLQLVNLENGKITSTQELGSWHSWSQNSRWMIFASKRDDQRYGRLYIVHVAPDGSTSKAFVLPQPEATHFYDMQLNTYSIPELVSGHVDMTPQQFQQSISK